MVSPAFGYGARGRGDHLSARRARHPSSAGGSAAALFLSARSRFAPGAAIRGGVPLVFPWFGARAGHPTAPDHGFARISEWTVESVERAGDGVAVTLGLEASEATRALWPYEFRLTYRVLVHAALELTLEVENRSKAPFSFEEALHTYLAVGDVREASVTGLEGRAYIDKTDGMQRKTLAAGPFRPSGETDRVFPGSHRRVRGEDPVLGRRLSSTRRAPRPPWCGIRGATRPPAWPISAPTSGRACCAWRRPMRWTMP